MVFYRNLSLLLAVLVLLVLRTPALVSDDGGSPFVSTFTVAELLFVEVDGWEGEALLALVDTGASASAIDPRRSADLPLLERSEVLGTTGTIEVDTVELEGLSLGATALPPLRATRRPLDGLLAPSGRRVDMILGSDAFAALALTIDFEFGRLGLTASSDPNLEASKAMPLDHGIPTLQARLGGLVTQLRIDTGASLFESDDVYINVPHRVWKQLLGRDPGLSPKTSLQGTGADGTSVDLPVVELAECAVGPLDLDRVFAIVQPEQGYFALPEAKGFVGNNYLRRFARVTLDYRNERFQAWPRPEGR